MLALHFDQQRTGSAQQCDPHRLIIDESAGAAVLGDDAAQDDIVLGVQPLLGQQRERGMTRGWGEAGGDTGLFGARAHQPCIGARAERQPEAIQQDGFTGPGFTGQDGQPSAEREV
jgi:hypothetical protein